VKSKLASAMKMEIDGEQFYLKQAELNQGTTLHRAFQLLAQAERKHADLLRRKMASTETSFGDELSQDESASLFRDRADYHRDAEVVPGQLEVYIIALDMEQKSIELYQSMLPDASDEITSQLLKYLVKQEQDHYAFFDELAALLRKPRDWVEAAEFNPAKEY
jgi:rubrerythrin